jgi:hypothetical protein
MSFLTNRLKLVLTLAVLAIPLATLGVQAVVAAQEVYGYGKCYKCNCRHFEGSSNTCANSGCGHSYYDHY